MIQKPKTSNTCQSAASSKLSAQFAIIIALLVSPMIRAEPAVSTVSKVSGVTIATPVAAATAAVTAAVTAANTALPADSVYVLDAPLTDQNGRKITLNTFRGKPALVTMFYSGCQYVCPRIVEALRRTESSLPGAMRNKLPILMVSFDTKNDTPPVLKKMAAERNLNDTIWTLAQTDERSTRKIAALLGIQYRELPSGDFNHTSVLILLDAAGRIVGRTSVIGEADPVFVKLVAKQMATTVQ